MVFLQGHAERNNIAKRTGTTSKGTTTPSPLGAGVTVPDSAHHGHSHLFSQASSDERSNMGVHHSGSLSAVNGGLAATETNGVDIATAATGSTSSQLPAPAECNGFSSFVLRSTFASGSIILKQQLCTKFSGIYIYFLQNL